MKPTKWGLTPFFLILLIAGCATSLPKVEPEKLPSVPAQFKENFTTAAPAEAQPRGEWWKAFSDPVLDELVARAERANSSVQVAAARLAQARAVARTTHADGAPLVTAGGGAQRFRGIFNGSPAVPARNLFDAGVDLSYEVDLFGRLSHASAAAALDAQASEGLLQSTRLLVQAQVAQNYLALRALDEERALVRTTLGAYRETHALTGRGGGRRGRGRGGGPPARAGAGPPAAAAGEPRLCRSGFSRDCGSGFSRDTVAQPRQSRINPLLQRRGSPPASRINPLLQRPGSPLWERL
jgi:hypothetical protein